ncbi:FAD binding domain-containing protein [Coprinopsis marcescibilis]|uniref:FAD binding domain-containing protein n=1 Tax=Coprinopsis marcescibilis TaxID=230819 RepID=A0A5C3KR18_COPMA|nr:FAD binding domain-containing protein [Coprinopsis marcescibilis]
MASHEKPVQTDILTSLTSLIDGDVVTRTDPAYSVAISRWATNAERLALAVVYPKTNVDVSKTVLFAQSHQVPFAICGGGHSASGASSVEDGLVLDMSRYFKDVRVDVEQRLAYVGGGALWRDVDKETMKYGLAAVGGTVSHGVPHMTDIVLDYSLTLGGGYGWLSGQHGLVSDNLQQATVVTADGTIRTVNDTENAELFWAIRGGGSNFGVVTEFVFRLHPQREKVFGGRAMYGSDKIEALIEVTREWLPRIKENEGIFQTAVTMPDGNHCIFAVFFYNGSEEEGRENFKQFFDIGPIGNTTREITYEEMNRIYDLTVSHGKPRYIRGTGVALPDYASVLAMLRQTSNVAKSGEGLTLRCLYEYTSLAKINSVPQSSTAFRRTSVHNVLVMINWEGEEDKTARARGIINDVVESMKAGSLEKGSISEADTAGYANSQLDICVQSTHDQLEKAARTFGSNLDKLREVKRRFDPTLFFNRWFPIPPAQ